ncbi:MAG: DUF2817 domain-containing protein [Nitrospirota bacterium]
MNKGYRWAMGLLLAIVIGVVSFLFFFQGGENLLWSREKVQQTLITSDSDTQTVDEQENRITIGFSVKKRPIEAIVIGSGEDVTLILAGVHGDEPEGTYVAEMLIKYLLSEENNRFERKKIIIIPQVNPDGLVSKIRGNANKVDINRNFPTRDWNPNARNKRYNLGQHPGSEPETQAIIRALQEFKPNKVISIHSPCYQINFDGPAVELAMEMASYNSYSVRPYIGYPTQGSLGTYAGKERAIPTITLELARVPKELAWFQNKEALIAAIYFSSKTHIGKPRT